MRGLSAREIMARLKVSMWQLPGHRQRHAEAQARSRKRDTAVRRHPGDADRPAAASASRPPSSVPTAKHPSGKCSDPTASLITRFDCGAAVFGKHWKFRRVARQLGTEPSETICIGDEIRDIEAANAAGMDSGAVAWGYALSERAAGGGTDAFLQFDRGDHAEACLGRDGVSRAKAIRSPRPICRYASKDQRAR